MTGKPVLPQKEHFLIVEDDKGRQEIILNDPMYSLGRAQTCDIRLRSQFVSRHHATLFRCERENGASYYRIVDGDAAGKVSANGMLVNGRKVPIYDLKDGDEVVFGPQVIAIYHYRQRDEFPTTPYNDPFDITLINPAMMENGEEATDSVKEQEQPKS
jgi:pSer/pThr/pTyr-binding forkhead associated (FHA) protein